MNTVGYLVTLLNLHAFGGNGGEMRDLSVKVNNVGTLANDLKNYPEFTIEDFRDKGYYRIGDVGMYLSNNLRNFIFNNGDPNEEGTIIMILYKTSTSGENEDDAALSYMFRRDDLKDDEMNAFIDAYLNDFHRRLG